MKKQLTQHLPAKQAKEILRKLLSVLGSNEAELSVLLTTDKEIQKLNSQFRHKDKATDVLSFPTRFVSGGLWLLGDIVISVETARKQAKKFGVTLHEELIRLLVHGLLHLHGYDHEGVSKSFAEKMRRKEKSLLHAILSDTL